MWFSLLFGIVPAEVFSEIDFGALFSMKAKAATPIVDGDVAYTCSGSEATIVDYHTSVAGTITIPSTISGYTVTKIGDSAFENCSDVVVIELPEGVKTIGNYAFRYCSSLKKVVIPETVTSIASNAFNGCTDFVVACVEDSYIHQYCFDNGIDYTFTSSPIEYKIANSTLYNKHTYAMYDVETNWKDAKAACEMLGGHLVVITDTKENSVVVELAKTGTMEKGYLFGATDEEKEGTWKWVTGESFSYNSWGSSEPSGGSEHYLEYYLPKSYWNDTTISSTGRGFICEFEDMGVPVKTTIANGSIYSVYEDSLSWTDAKKFCENIGGHLVTITSEEEQNLVTDLIIGHKKELFWIGLNDTVTDGKWEWVTGEEVVYTNWSSTEPSNGTHDSYGDEDYVHILAKKFNDTKPIGCWNDDHNYKIMTGDYRTANAGFVCEIELDKFQHAERQYYGNNLYEIYSESYSWYDAKLYAESKGGHLAVITDTEENDFIVGFLSHATASNGFWLGATDEKVEGYWQTVTREDFLYTNWASGEPNNGTNRDENYLEYYLPYSGWNDAKTSGTGRGFIIEYENHHENVSFYESNGTLIETRSVQGNLPISKPAEFEKTGYTTDWYTDIELTNQWDFNNVITEETVLYARRVPNKYTVNFDYNGATGKINKKTVTFDSKYGSLPKPTREGYTFGGWFTADGKEVTYSTIVNKTSDIMLYAKWMPNEYVVDFNLNGGATGNANGELDSITVSYGSEYGILPTPSKEGYRFSGWYLSDGTTKITSDSIVQTASDHTLVANWTESQISSVVIGSLPNKTEYVLGESLKTDGLTLLVTFDNGETAEITEGYTCEPLKFESTGSSTVKVSYEGFEAQFKVTITKGLPISISINSLPDKTKYNVGETFNPNGLTLLAEYSDGSEETISKGFECSASVFGKEGTYKVKVTYYGCSATVNVTVVNSNPIGVTVENLPDKLQYCIGEELDITGLALKVEYPNSVFKMVTTGFEVTCDLSSAGAKKVSVTYYENGIRLTTNFTVNVTAEKVASVWASDVSASAGESVSIPVNISNNPGFMGFSLIVEYDESVLTPVSVSAGDMLSDGTLDNSIGGSLPAGKIKITFKADENIVADGMMFAVDFTINEKAQSGESFVEVSYLPRDTFNENYDNINLVCSGSAVLVSNQAEDKNLTFYSESMSVNAGEQLSLPVYVRNANGLSDFTLTLDFNSDILKFRQVQSDFIKEAVNNGNGTVTLKCSNVSISADNTVVFNAIFYVAEYIESQETIKIVCSSATVNGKIVEIVCSDAKINITNPHTNEPAFIHSNSFVVLTDNYIDLPVYINNNHGIMGLGINVAYDSGILEPVSVKKGDILSNGNFEDNIESVSGNVKIRWNNSADVVDNGLLFTLRFNVLDKIALKTMPISFTYSQENTYNEKWEDIEIDINIDTIMVKQEYTIRFVADGRVVTTQNFISGTSANEIVLPQVPEKIGYTGQWETFILGNNDVDVNCIYTPVVYTATFIGDGKVIGTDTFTVEDDALDYPYITKYAYYDWVWDEHKIEAKNITVEGRYVPITYTITFVSSGKVLKTQEYNINTVDSIVAPVKSLPAKQHYTTAWEDWTGKVGNITVNEIYVPIKYKISFYCQDKLVATRSYTIEASESQIILPEVPKINGYDVKWPELKFAYKDQRIYATCTPIVYTAQFVAEGVVIDTQTFTVETEKLNEPAVPQKAGYIAAWSGYVLEAKNIIIYAKYYPPEVVMKAKVTMKVDETTRLLTSCNFNATKKTWSSSNPEVATVDNHGNVTAVGKGECKIIVTCYGKDSFENEIEASASTKIVVNEKSEATDLKQKFREAFDEFFEVKLHDFLENLKRFMIVLLRYAY